MKALETLKVEHDGTVRNSRDDIVQFVYGADDFDACYLMRISLDFAQRPWNQLARELTQAEMGPFRRLLDTTLRYRGTGAGEFDTQAFAPIRLEASLVKALKVKGTSVEQETVEEKVDALCREVGRAPVGARTYLELYLRWELKCSSLLPLEISSEGLTHLLKSLRTQIARAKVDAQEMVGALASHSISSPLTQLVFRGREVNQS